MAIDDDKFKEPAGTYGLDLPIAPAWFSEPPKGSIDDGIHLSLLAIEQMGDPSAIFAERDRRMCDAEFML